MLAGMLGEDALVKTLYTPKKTQNTRVMVVKIKTVTKAGTFKFFILDMVLAR